jgi:F0F1-type ATP synthase delta subunit
MSGIDFKSRIVGHGEEAPDQLLANPANWRIHPRAQQDAMKGVLDQVGWVQSVIVNRVTGHLIDGHMRVSLALREDAKTIPVAYVELTPEEESLVLATLDPLGALAGTDKEKLAELLEEVSVDSKEVERLLNDLVGDAQRTLDDEANKYSADIVVPQYAIVGDRPAESELTNQSKAEELRAAIESAEIEPEVKDFLLTAATRHIVFDYSKVAEYYAHAPKEVQELMEDSALVIVDFDDAIRNGYIKLTQTINDLEEQDRDDA